MTPQLNLHAHYRKPGVQLKKWRSVAVDALPHCLAAIKGAEAPLRSLEEVEVTFINDKTIAQVHADFMNDPTPTDVITFHHGEILISLDTAAAQSQEHHHPYEREVALYIIHGLLHLAGWEDAEPVERAQMHRLQETILEQVW